MKWYSSGNVPLEAGTMDAKIVPHYVKQRVAAELTAVSQFPIPSTGISWVEQAFRGAFVSIPVPGFSH